MTWFGYTPAQWGLFFYLYSFLGWLWESGYVSFRQGRWVNRGFLRGPILPLYGFGALALLSLLLPWAASPALTFLVGMTGATALEYITGQALESLFGVRYWDYSKEFLQFGGHICLKFALCWIVLAQLLAKVVHPFLELFLKKTGKLAVWELLYQLFFADCLFTIHQRRRNCLQTK